MQLRRTSWKKAAEAHQLEQDSRGASAEERQLRCS